LPSIEELLADEPDKAKDGGKGSRSAAAAASRPLLLSPNRVLQEEERMAAEVHDAWLTSQGLVGSMGLFCDTYVL